MIGCYYKQTTNREPILFFMFFNSTKSTDHNKIQITTDTNILFIRFQFIEGKKNIYQLNYGIHMKNIVYPYAPLLHYTHVIVTHFLSRIVSFYVIGKYKLWNRGN